MGKKPKLTPKEEVGTLKGALLFCLASMQFHGLLDDAQHKYWIGRLKEVGIYEYKLVEYVGEEKSFEDIMRKGGK